MYFLYVDESGQTAIKQNRSDNGMYILSGVLVHEKDWKSIESALDETKRELLPKFSPRAWELHAHAIWNDREFFANAELGLNIAKKEEIFSRIVEAACGHDITIINTVIFKDRLTNRRSSEVMRRSWSMLVGGFEGFLHKMPAQTNNGLIFMDSSQRVSEEDTRRIVRRLAGGRRRDSHHVLETPIFVESHMWNLIQLADMIAYVVHRHYKKDPRFEKWFESLVPKMYHSGGKLYGHGMRTNRNYSGKQVRTHAERLLP